ncbi:HD domain-containing protein C4G3.17 [Taphrina deformans PYCC 5710]|uniref:5'-deoxynucleotidase n=1 Tax=Taphrina deformans (strain PYCC 5710 / ATCC 11124 / CBS 356.35 / IMI 108563 / JCM 9778 / NBRC 8474) TaxID=1097556 RepID=R4XAC5_TAPDE|nr:HD domain-containing protein C4G3.17 [Taphrina deformans PYCC 5710]|eukprot:CCG81224.1 HD domain-containing protein C4G3.17 [Taphrina deformans PYCC 5710]
MDVLPFLNLIENLKTTPRTGWINEHIRNPESIADHMYRMAIITMLCTDPALDKARMMKIAVVHDMAEAIVGDITPLSETTKAEKQALELGAMVRICQDLLPASQRQTADELMALFLEYEHKTSPEARFVKDVDKYELVLQTFEYERAGRVKRRLDDFVGSSRQIVHPLVRSWCDEVLAAREAWWNEQGGEASL